jgi:hypothetical protein
VLAEVSPELAKDGALGFGKVGARGGQVASEVVIVPVEQVGEQGADEQGHVVFGVEGLGLPMGISGKAVAAQ